MVNWYDLRQLLSTGVQVLVSAAIGQRSDYRMMEDVALHQPVFDYSFDEAREPRSELWFDFLADTGDGWNPTYAVASLVACDELQVSDGNGSERTLQHGAFLLLGGDEVYPVASQRNYRERLVGPFTAALPPPEASPPSRDLFAIPGNHDWYDGLVSFSRLFTQDRWIGGWRTRQRRSYFVLKLPARWWLWAVDVQLEADIDFGQRRYFQVMGEQLQPGDRVILVSAEPDWLYRDIEQPVEANSNLAYLEQKIIKDHGASVYLWLAGDLHHYRRHEDRKDARFQRITSGGGGAYLFPTHGPLFGASSTVSRATVVVGERDFQPRCTFPSSSTSLRLSFGNLLFLFRNWKFGILTAVVYAALTWGAEFGPRAAPWWAQMFANPSRLVWIVLVVVGFVLYADRERPVFRYLGGALHGAAHITAALLIAAWSAHYFGSEPVAQVRRVAANFVGGALVGPVLVGLYLLVALDLFGAHADTAFSALRIQDFKHFLRLRVTRNGRLEIFPIGLPRVPRDGEAHARYMLIEDPIVIRPT